MLGYECLDTFRGWLERDQAPTKKRLCDVEENRKIFSIRFDTDYDGNVSIDCHIQWGLMEQLMVDKYWDMTWDAYDPEIVHLHLTREQEKNVVYTVVMTKAKLKTLWERIHGPNHPFPEDEAAEDIWVQLYNRGVWEM